jgi:hypothetical protein
MSTWRFGPAFDACQYGEMEILYGSGGDNPYGFQTAAQVAAAVTAGPALVLASPPVIGHTTPNEGYYTNLYVSNWLSTYYMQIGGPGGPTWNPGVGAPTSNCPNGSLYSRTDGGVGSTLYLSRGSGVWSVVA